MRLLEPWNLNIRSEKQQTIKIYEFALIAELNGLPSII